MKKNKLSKLATTLQKNHPNLKAKGPEKIPVSRRKIRIPDL